MDFNVVVQYTDWKCILKEKSNGTPNSKIRENATVKHYLAISHCDYTRKIGEISLFQKLWEFCLRHSLMLHWPQNNLYDKPHHLAVAYSSESELEKVEGYVRWLGTRRSRDFHFLYPYLLLENWDRRLKRQAARGLRGEAVAGLRSRRRVTCGCCA